MSASIASPIMTTQDYVHLITHALKTPSHRPQELLDLPRRKHKEQATSVQEIASTLYPELELFAAVIKYDNLVPQLRRETIEMRKKEEERRKDAKGYTFREAVRRQGKFIRETHEFPTPKAEPMPVQISSEETLAPFFSYLKENQPFPNQTDSQLTEPHYKIPMIEFEKGVLYQDHRMDLCKMTLGPQNIGALMQALRCNQHVEHFLLGNNITGRKGAEEIASFIKDRPDQIRTWYLGANLINAESLKLIARQLRASKSVQGLWLKRNPLGPESVQALIEVANYLPSLLTLDLDQTEIGDDGVSELFNGLILQPPISLRTIYLNCDGVSIGASESIGRYLSQPNCALENVYMSGNPIGDDGALSLARGLTANRSLKRINLASCGINSEGAIAIIASVVTHPRLISIGLAQASFSADLKARYNYIEDLALNGIIALIQSNSTLRSFNLGVCAMTPSAIAKLQVIVSTSKLHFFDAKSCFARVNANRLASRRLAENVLKDLNMEYDEFLRTGIRFLRSPEDVRLVDSIYRNRDAGQARRKKFVLKKAWDNHDLTLDTIEI